MSTPAEELLKDLPPPTREELELYLPQELQNLGPAWGYAKGKVLGFTERHRTRTVGSHAGFDVAKEFDERYSVYVGIYGYLDHRGRLHTFRLPPTENDRDVRPGRTFIIVFNRARPRKHRLFVLRRP